MSTIKPRHAVGYHFFNEQATHDDILRGVLQTYTGPNKPPMSPARGSVPDPISLFINAGRWQPAEKAQAPMVEEFKKENGLK